MTAASNALSRSDRPLNAVATIDLTAYARNLATVQAAVAPAVVMAVVKADAYGHGLLQLSAVAVGAGIRWLGALDIDTALKLRAQGFDDVGIFAWLLGPGEEYGTAVRERVELGVSTIEQLDEIDAAAAGVPALVHLKIDTGLHRNGATEEEWPELVERAIELEHAGVVELRGVWTHISEASDEDDSAAMAKFDAAIAVVEGLGARVPLRHLAASAAGFTRADARYDLVRLGAFGYGIAPGGGIGPGALGLIPVMTLEAPVIAVTDGLARIAIGYGEGLPSAIAGRTELAIDGVRHPIVEVGLDWLDASIGSAEVRPGDIATLFGAGDSGEQTLQEWADAIGTIGEEIVTRLSGSIPRRYLEG
jgi:alanine racemase